MHSREYQRSEKSRKLNTYRKCPKSNTWSSDYRELDIFRNKDTQTSIGRDFPDIGS